MPMPTMNRPQQQRQSRRQSGDQRADDEDEAGDQDDPAPSEPVGEAAREGRAHRRAGERDARHQAFGGRREAEIGSDEQQRAGDHPGVIAEQQSAKRRYSGNQIETRLRLSLAGVRPGSSFPPPPPGRRTR